MSGLSAKRFSRAAVGVLAAIAAGCSLQPVYDRPPSAVASAYPTGPA